MKVPFFKEEKKEEPPKIEPRVIPFNELIQTIAMNTEKLVRSIRLNFIYLTIVTGRGLEFEKLREYTPQDDAKLIDWKATARTSKPYVKVFKEERMLDVIFVVDVSNTMLLGTTDYLKNEYAAIVTGILANAALIAGDLIGLLAFSDEIKALAGPTANVDDVYGMFRILSTPKYYGGVKDFSVLPRTMLHAYKDDSVIFFISDFIGTYKSRIFEDLILMAGNKFRRVFGIMVRDPLDSKLPEGVGSVYLRDPNTGEEFLVEITPEIRKRYEEEARREEEYVERVFKNAGALFMKAYTNEDFTRPFLRLLESGEI